MRYHLWIEDNAKDEISRLPGNFRQRMRRAVSDLAYNPRPSIGKRLDLSDEGLAGLEIWRLRIDPWRVIYVIDDGAQEVGVLAVRKRPPYDYADVTELMGGL